MEICIFCKIISGDIPGVKIYENDHILAFLDISQSTKGHTLLIPKKHIKNVFELTEDDAIQLYSQVPKIATAIQKAFGAKGLNIVNNNNEAAGQTVFHYHVHLIPRYDENDGFDTIYTNNMANYTNDDLNHIASQIKEHIKTL